MTNSSPSKQYTLTVNSDVISAEISLQAYSTATMKDASGKVVSSITATPTNNNIVFTVEGAEYINAVTNSVCMFKAAGANESTKTNSQCNICFILNPESSFVWQATGKRGQGDNPSMFPPGSGKNTTEHDTTTVTVQKITEANPSVPPSSAQVLRPSQVFLVDWDINNKTILVRGNSPLGEESKGGQTINFANLQSAIVNACTAAHGPTLADLGNYVLHDIALLSSAEEYIWANEYFSFTGNSGEPNSAQRTWFPSTPTPLRGINSGTPTGQMSRWNVEPVDATVGSVKPTILIDLVTHLKTWMETPEEVYNVYYIHCASGHDRTGMVASTYLAYKSLTSSIPLGPVATQIDKSFIYGTTLQHQSSTGGDIVQECYNFGTTTLSSSKSRCFLADENYNDTFLTALMNLVPPSEGTYSLGSDTTRTPSNESGSSAKPYVMAQYPFSEAYGFATMVDGIVSNINVIEPGSGYTSAPTVTVEASPNGMTAEATAIITNGSVTSVEVTNQGSGYDNPPQVTFSEPN